jgi:hypothetical protein
MFRDFFFNGLPLFYPIKIFMTNLNIRKSPSTPFPLSVLIVTNKCDVMEIFVWCECEMEKFVCGGIMDRSMQSRVSAQYFSR